MTIDEAISAWSAKVEVFRNFHALVDAQVLCEAFVADLRAVLVSPDQDLLKLTEAAERSGYSREHLGRLVRDGVIPNAGRPGAPKIRLKDVPRKAGRPSRARVAPNTSLTTKQQIVRSIVDRIRSSPQ
jgi:hypothetical protein